MDNVGSVSVKYGTYFIQEKTTACFTQKNQTGFEESIKLADIDVLASNELAVNYLIHGINLFSIDTPLDKKEQVANTLTSNDWQLILSVSQCKLTVFYLDRHHDGAIGVHALKICCTTGTCAYPASSALRRRSSSHWRMRTS